MLGGGGSLLSKLKSLVQHKKPRSLPDDLYIEIFIRLPVKSTFTCKCVSKTWFSIISNPDFVKLHLNYTLKINKYSKFIMLGYDSEILIYSTTKDSLFPRRKFYRNALVMDHYPFKSSYLVGRVGSCNGLVCLLHRDKVTKFFSLWNPATKEYKWIPPDPPGSQNYYYWGTYFCYDYKNDDYKLVYGGYSPSLKVYVYTLRSNSWKSFQTAKPYNFGDGSSAFVNGALHWIGRTPNIIVSFNISDERFKEIQIPGDIMDKSHLYTSRLYLNVLEGCLRVYAPNKGSWVMREYGVWESWTKHQNQIPNRYGYLTWSSENGECQIYCDDVDLVLYDWKHSSARRVLNLGDIWIRDIDNYVESLVSLNTGAYLGRTRRRGLWRKRYIFCRG